MRIKPVKNTLKLHGFNNLSKTLSFCLYDICYVCDSQSLNDYLEYVDEKYRVHGLYEILQQTSEIIGANILHVSRQSYEPRGSSINLLLSEGAKDYKSMKLDQNIVCHLDKSHITLHTYPESHPKNGIHTFRTDLEISTCGQISPLKALDFVVSQFQSDAVVLDYRVRGFSREIDGSKIFIDHEIDSIQDFLCEDLKGRYLFLDVNLCQENIFHTRMIVKELKFEKSLFGIPGKKEKANSFNQMEQLIRREQEEIFYVKKL